MQAAMVLEKELRVLHLEDNKRSTDTLDGILSIGNLKACPHSDTLPPTRLHLLQKATTLKGAIVPLPKSLWGPITLKLPH